MAYIGAQPNKQLTKTTSQSFNGTGSATAFTLNRAVNTGEELEVFVGNVQQEPGSGKSYTATGTTLTFDEAPPSGTGNVYVIYRGQAEVTTRLEAPDLSITTAKLAASAVTTAKIADDAVTSDKLASGAAQTPISVAVIADVKSNSTSGGTSISWGSGGNNRDLNTKLFDPDNIVTISSNQFILGAGTYIIEFSAPSYFGDRHIAQLYDVTNSASVQYGSMEYSHGTNGGYGSSFGYARVVITSNTTYKIVHYIESGKSSNGLGVNASLSGVDSIYTQVKITKMG
mgnify:CR=1 FL=1|tara:strand:+ start:1021 stop:1875 length:855 start_codon:yes stop_codon:yes gene_type:complete